MFSKILLVVALASGAVAQTVVELAVATPTLSTLVAVLTMPSYKPVLDALSGSGPFTVFAPTDDAFATAGVDPSNVDAVTKVLQYHVLSGAVPSAALQATQDVATLNGAKVTVKKSASGVTVNDANVVIADVLGSNGVVHVIDKVLLPPAPTPSAPVRVSIFPSPATSSHSMSQYSVGSNWGLTSPFSSFGYLPYTSSSFGSYLPSTPNWASTLTATSVPLYSGTARTTYTYLPSTTNWASTLTSTATSVPLYSGTARTTSAYLPSPSASFGSYLPPSWVAPSTMNWANPLSTTSFGGVGAFGYTPTSYSTPASSGFNLPNSYTSGWNFPTYTLGAPSTSFWG